MGGNNTLAPTPASDALSVVDYVAPNGIQTSDGRASLIVLEDNEAVIRMTIKGRSSNMRHAARTHRVALDWLNERIRVDPGISIKYVGTKEQIADFFTKGKYTAEQGRAWCELSQTGARTQ